MNRAVSGVVCTRVSGRPLVGLRLVVAVVETNVLSILGTCFSADSGKFRVSYPELSRPVDLTVFVFSPNGHFLFREPIHRAVSGAELVVRIEVPNR